LVYLTQRRAFVLSATLTLALGLIIAFLTLTPISGPNVPGSDKLYHTLACAALAFPLPFARSKLMIPVIVFVILYGGMIELIQPHVGRSGEWKDLFADAAGAILGAGLGAFLGNRIVQYGGRQQHDPIKNTSESKRARE